MAEKVFQLKCFCNSYDWGRVGRESLAATLCEKTPDADFKIDETKPYAEMWMGTYPDLPSYILSSGEKLQDVMDKHAKELIGQKVIDKFGHTQLPYLPKVLSIAKALPLQLHPNKDLASKLHKEDPSQFTDPNHKPEIALALSEFEAFVGFRPLKDIDRLFQSLDPLRSFIEHIGDKSISSNKDLKKLVQILLKSPGSHVAQVYEELVVLAALKFGENDQHIPKLLPRLAGQYNREDNGILVALLTMNYLVLQPGAAIYIPADGIHAYLSGDIIECMARSNNVLNTGFCPKADRNSVDVFCSVLTFTPHQLSEAMLSSKAFSRSSSGQTVVYNPPLSEFSVLAVNVSSTIMESISALDGPAILLVTKATPGQYEMYADGNVHKLEEGYIYFIGQGTRLVFVGKSGQLQAFIAYVE